MQQLDFAELDEDGRLVVVGDDGTRYAVPVDDRLRAALRPRPARRAEGDEKAPTASPREVQAMIRAGQTADEVAAATGWDPHRVRRFEGPVLAEREHVVGLAKAAHVRAQGRTDGSHTLDRRVRERLDARGVPTGDTAWDAARTESQGPWTVMVVFTAGGRERRAAWHYDVHDRSIEALDDEARWLSEDEQALPGGLEGHPLLGGSHSEDETADLMATMRERRQARGRRGRAGQAGRGQAAARSHEEVVLPLEDLPEPVEADAPDEEDLPPAAHPRGSAAESPAPVRPVEEVPADPDAGAETPEDTAEAVEEETDHRPTPARRRGAAKQARARREQRRLRMPKLPPAVGEPPVEEDGGDEPEGSFARTVDPQEVSFDEFFGPEDDPLAVGTAEVQDTAGSSGGDDTAQHVPDLDDGEGTGDVDGTADDEEVLDPGQDEPVDAEEQIGAPYEATGGTEDDEATGGTEDVEVEDGSAQDGADSDGSTPDGADSPVTEEASDSSQAEEPEPTRRKARRTSVPSWDDIMFGGGSDRRRR